MRLFGPSLAILAGFAAAAVAAPGDQWILGIHHFTFGPFPETVGAGYGGIGSSGAPQYVGNSYSHAGAGGDSSRIYWELNGPTLDSPGDYNHDGFVDDADYVVWRKTGIDGQEGYNTWRTNFGKTGNFPPTTTELYTIEYWGVAQPNGHNDYQVIESQFHGEGGEEYPYDSHIPWAGQFGQNHQWIQRNDIHAVGEWVATGPFGPQAPSSNEFNADGFGTYMWLTSRSQLYVKWDFGWPTNRAWSALRLTQVTENGQFVMGTSPLNAGVVPEPAGLTMMVAGVFGAAWFGRRQCNQAKRGCRKCALATSFSDLAR